MNPYTTLWTGVHPGDGPQEFHLVLLDNGRTEVLAAPVGRQALHCIRCSACLNICPVYSRVGGHAYHATYPGPIGSILTPQLLGPGVHDTLPFASTLCGACQDVCPVGIEIPRVLLQLRGRAQKLRGEGWGRSPVGRLLGSRAGQPSVQERLLMYLLGRIFSSSRLYRWCQRALWGALKIRGNPRWLHRLPGYGKGWTVGRDFPTPAPESFREWWAGRGMGQARSDGEEGGGL